MAFRLKTLQEITSHPLTRNQPLGAIQRYVRFHLSQRLFPYPLVYPWVGSLQLLARRGWAGVVGNIYTGLYDFEDMGFLLHCLQAGECFVDLGANAGVYSLLAAGICQARVVAVEPVPETFNLLKAQIRLNQLEDMIEARQMGLGAQAGNLSFSLSMGTMNHVVTNPGPTDKVLEVPVVTLDQLMPGPVHLIKMDTEGFELPVLQGGQEVLARPELSAVIIELNGSGTRYGYQDHEIDALLRRYGFAPYRYWPFERRLEALKSWRSDHFNTLYLREPEHLQALLATAAQIEVLGQCF